MFATMEQVQAAKKLGLDVVGMNPSAASNLITRAKQELMRMRSPRVVEEIPEALPEPGRQGARYGHRVEIVEVNTARPGRDIYKARRLGGSHTMWVLPSTVVLDPLE